MKNLLKIITILIWTSKFANAQTIDKKLQKLVYNKLIKQKEVNKFQKLLKNSETLSNALYLTILFEFENKRLTGDNYSQFDSYFSFGNGKLKPAEQTKINEELTQYLSRLKSSELLNKNQFDHFQSKINKNEFAHSLQLLPPIIEQVSLKELMSPEKLIAFADKLKSKEIIGSKYSNLIEDINLEKLQNPIDLLNYFNKAVIIKEQDYPNEPEKYLELIHKKTASIISELSFKNFEFQVMLDSSISDKESKFYEFVVSINSNGQKYKHKSSYQLYSPSKNQYYGNKIDQQEYYKIFNKILADLQSPYRLHEVKVYKANAVEWEIFGIIALTKEQADLLHGAGTYLSTSYENFKNKFTTYKIEQAIEEYKKIGLLAHLTNDQIKKAQIKVSEHENSNLNDVLMAFPNVIHMFDTELENLKDPYAELIREYKKISHNDFNATEIFDNFDIINKKKVELKFKIADKTYSKTFKIEDDWIDTKFFNFISAVFKDQKFKGLFYELYTSGQEASIIYLTDKQYNYLRTNNLLIFNDQLQIEEE